MEKVKILQYFWGKLDTGGAETFIINLFENIDRTCFEMAFCAYEDKEYFYTNRILENGGIIVPLQKRESRILVIRLLQRWINLYRVLRKGKFDVFHCNCDFSFKWIEMYIARIAGVNTRICHSHNTAIDTTTLKGKIQNVIHKICIPLLVCNTTDFMACSKESAYWLFGKKIDIEKVHIINNGIDADYYAFCSEARCRIREQLRIDDECIVIGNVGRFTVIKNQKFIVDIIEQAVGAGINMKAVLIGTGTELDNVKRLVKDKKLDDYFLFVGLTDRVRDYLMAFDCYVMPSLYEGLPVSGIEAQATGLGCVVSDTVDKNLKITDNLIFHRLDEGASVWLKSILSLAPEKRNDNRFIVQSNGYDIRKTAEYLEKIYRK